MKGKSIIYFLPIVFILFQSCNQFVNKDIEVSQWRGPDRNGIFKETNLLDKWPEKGPELLWKYNNLGTGYSSATFGNNKVFTLGTKDSITSLFAFSMDGKLLWKKEMGKEWSRIFPGARSTPLIYGKKGYVFDGLGVMHCFNIEDGSILWKKNLIEEYDGIYNLHGITENLIIDGEKLFCTLGGKENNILALNKDTGEKIWVCKGKGEVNAYCSPALIKVGGKKYYITTTYNSLISVDIETGKLIWTKQFTEPRYGIHANTPIYKDGLLFVIEGELYGAKMFRISEDGQSAELVWKLKNIDPQIGDAVLLGTDLFVSSAADRELYCLDWETGKTKFSTDQFEESTIIAADDKLFIQTYKGKIAMLKPENNEFKILGQFDAPGKRPNHYAQQVIRDGRLYIRYYNSLVVYDIKEK